MVVVKEPESDTLLQATPEQGFGGLAECIGKRFELGGAAVVPLPHPSGASSWLNSPANREHVAVAAKRI